MGCIARCGRCLVRARNVTIPQRIRQALVVGSRYAHTPRNASTTTVQIATPAPLETDTIPKLQWFNAAHPTIVVCGRILCTGFNAEDSYRRGLPHFCSSCDPSQFSRSSLSTLLVKHDRCGSAGRSDRHDESNVRHQNHQFVRTH
jgi:hypothetical protein